MLCSCMCVFVNVFDVGNELLLFAVGGYMVLLVVITPHPSPMNYSFDAIWPIKFPVNFSIFFKSGIFSALYWMHWNRKKAYHEPCYVVHLHVSYLDVVGQFQQYVTLVVNIFHCVATSAWIGHVHIFGSDFKVFPTFYENHGFCGIFSNVGEKWIQQLRDLRKWN